MRVTHLAPTTSLSFVHTARRYYRLNDLVRLSDRTTRPARRARVPREDDQTVPFRGSKSRNKVSVGEPAGGSLKISKTKKKKWRGALRGEEIDRKVDEGPRTERRIDKLACLFLLLTVRAPYHLASPLLFKFIFFFWHPLFLSRESRCRPKIPSSPHGEPCRPFGAGL